MKKNVLFGWLTMMMAAFVSVGVVSCGSDDDDSTSLSETKYEGVSARYDVTSSGSDIKTIELTESGEYVVSYKTGSSVRKAPAANAKAVKFFGTEPVATRASQTGQVVHGKYTKISDTEFQLQGFGKITITGTSDNAISITVSPVSGKDYTVAATKRLQNASSVLTNQICRTWKFSSLKYVYEVNGKKVIDKEYGVNEIDNIYKDLMDMSMKYLSEIVGDEFSWPEGMEADFGKELPSQAVPEQVIFTKSGTYMVIYKNDMLAVATWNWTNESKGQIRYSWDYSDMYEEQMSGNVNVSFRGNQLVITEPLNEYFAGNGEDSEIIWYLDEVK